MHPLGIEWGTLLKTCGQCAWAHRAGPGPKVLRCVAANNQRIEKDWKSCIHFEETLDCLNCAACCGPAFDVE